MNEVESGLSDAEHNKPVYDDSDSVELEEVIKQLEEQKVDNFLCRQCCACRVINFKLL